jgi:protein-tyrosine-phosphatase
MENIQSVLFCCDHNAIRSPIAEGIFKKFYGKKVFVQSAGVKHDFEIDGFAVAVCSEIGVNLEQHKPRSFDEIEKWGDDISSFDLIIALSPSAQRTALEYTHYFSLAIEYWPILDPTGLHEDRVSILKAYRTTRQQIMDRILDRFGEPRN